MYYLVSSFSNELPWSSCQNNTWSTDRCWDYSEGKTPPNNSVPSTQEFFDRNVLQVTTGIEDMGSMRWDLFGYLCLAWILVYFCLWKGIKSSGKVVYVTATVPYLLIGAFLWRALSLEGSEMGLKFFFQPKWEQLLEAKVWVNAAAQNFNSIGIAFGSLIAFASYNPFNNGLIRDTILISLVDAVTCILAGMCVFATLGNLAYEQGTTVEEVVSNGPGLVFVAYPQALAKMPGSTVWAIIFFGMLLCLGIDSQFATVEVIVTSLKDGYHHLIERYLKRHEVLVLLICFVSFIFGIPNVMEGGFYYFTLIDYYTAAISLMYIAFFEVIAIVWIYGADRLARNVRDMTGSLPNVYIRVCWLVMAPCLIMAIWIFSMIDYTEPVYNNVSDGINYHYPRWAILLGWFFASLSLGVIPGFAIFEIIKAPGDTWVEKIRSSFKSRIDNCPCCQKSLDEKHEAHRLTDTVSTIV
ncbi:sodium- and chloride-dependent GABA transporter ine-like [Artemia franciscana]